MKYGAIYLYLGEVSKLGINVRIEGGMEFYPLFEGIVLLSQHDRKDFDPRFWKPVHPANC